MSKNIKLIDYQEDLERGDILRCKGNYPYEDVVDFMVFESTNEYGIYDLVVTSGYKAGLRKTILPKESIPVENIGYAISIKWLKNNWSKWIYAECPVEEVWIIENEMPKMPIVAN